ncbi:MAG TPA: FAD:protein FMN transferase [Bryobacteraceae bacterium]|jgi:thiamine biosynthesis lipoprotein|nr:FAD:protein FMN transferase [Bryobacteraceae bacterium]
MKARVLTLLLGLALACLAAADQLQRVETTVDAMGTTYSIIAYGGDVSLVKAAVEDAAEEARRLDALLSNYLPASEWSQVNAQAWKRAVRVSPELFQLITQCVEYSKASDGAFDITVGPLMKVWGFYKGTGRLPKRDEVRAALERVGYRNILLDPKNNTVRFAREGVEIDPGGIGKGYAVDKMIEVLKADGITSAMVSAGGSSIYGLGTPPDERGWHTVIRDPKDANKTAAEVWLKDESLSTSGNYEKFFFAEGRMWSHIMDPRTGYPAEGVVAVSILAPRTIDSEAWAKPYYVRGRAWAARNVQTGFKVLMCEDKTGSDSCAWLQ